MGGLAQVAIEVIPAPLLAYEATAFVQTMRRPAAWRAAAGDEFDLGTVRARLAMVTHLQAQPAHAGLQIQRGGTR